jgi:signal transduction histidine kinase
LSAAQVTRRDTLRSVADSDETLSLVEEQILRLKGLVDNMLFLSQVDASSIHLERREFFLDDAISEAARGARALARAKQQTLRISELPEAPCSGDETLLKQAVLILLDNAVKYTQVGGEIAISLRGDEENWRCQVWNNGAAIPTDAQDHIFERFFRASGESSSKTSGSGLGLSIARSIAETHGGKLILISSGAEGTTFELRVPIVTGGDECAPSQPKSLAVKM